MGFFDTVMGLLDDKDDASFEKKMNLALDKIERTLGATVDKAEHGAKVLDKLSHQTDKVINTVDKQSERLTAQSNQTVNKVTNIPIGGDGN